MTATNHKECNETISSNGEDVILKIIPEAPNDDYRAGSDGHIYSRTEHKGFGRVIYRDWYPLKGHFTKKGYRTVSLCHNNKKVSRSVHRLICSAFHGPSPSPVHQVRHLDGNPNNNLPGNLCWGTQAENWQDRRIHGTASVGEKHPAAKLTDQEREHIRWAVSRGLCSRRHAARALGMSESAISGLCKKRP